MNNFRLLAIWPLPGCDPKFKKVLLTERPYVFYNEYSFEVAKGRLKQIVFTPIVPADLYQETEFSIPINISAIVGRNGSGKSSILELFYASAYLYSVNNNILRPNVQSLQSQIKQLTERHRRKKIADFKQRIDDLKESTRMIEEIRAQVLAEVFYTIDNKIFSFRLEGKKVEKHYEYRQRSSIKNTITYSRTVATRSVPRNFFYSIVVNYSLYGLNATILKHWINSLFHKNDGYRTPLVINPFREDGVIDVNIERHLAQSRLISNLTDQSLAMPKVLGEKVVEFIEFSIDRRKLDEVFTIKLENVVEQLEKDNDLTRWQIFERLYQTLLGEEISYSKHKEQKHFDLIVLYVLKKLIKIAYSYEPYQKLKAYDRSEQGITPRLRISKILPELRRDRSHITLKLKQILNTIRYGLLEEDLNKGILWVGDKIIIPVSILSERIARANGKSSKRELVEFVPVAFFQPEIFVINKPNDKESVASFSSLSSGEQHFIHSVHSIIYHLRNVNSVFGGLPRSRYTYQFINVILDEIELYFHPEMQQEFIDQLLSIIRQFRLRNIKAINILCSTHSPFILSDLPNANVLRLEEGQIKKLKPQEKTFATNIHKLLDEDFFLRQGFMGKWSKNFINNLIKSIPEDISTLTNLQKEELLKKIDIIGEPYIRIKLRDKLGMTDLYPAEK